MTYLPPVGEEESVFDDLERLRSRRASFAASATPETAAATGQLGFYYPWMEPGAALSLGKAGVKPDSPVARTAGKAAAKKKHKSGLGWHSIGDVVKGGVRGVTLVAQSGYEELQAQTREIAETVHKEGVVKGLLFGGGIQSPSEAQKRPHSSLQAAAQRLESGKRVDLGTGYFPGGEVAESQAEVARSYGTIQGHAYTPGRLLASAIVEPGTKPYNIMSGLTDAAVSIEDPGAALMGGTGKARQAAKLFVSDAGLVNGVRKTVLPEVADAWLASKDGRKVTERLATTDGVDDIWKLSNKKIPVDVAVELADAKTPAAVAEVIRTHAGIALREKPVLGGVGVTVKRHLEGVRLAQAMPGPFASTDDMNHAVEMLDRYQKNAKLPHSVVAANNEALARASGRPEQFNVVVNTAMGQIRDELIARGVDPDVAGHSVGGMTRAFVNSDREYAKFFVNEIGENVPVPGTVINGSAIPVPSPHLYTEFINRAIPLPNAREIRRATSKLAPVYKVPGVDQSIAVMDFAMNSVWKRLALIRGAWTVRVVGEEQIRMGQAGLDSVFHHPLSAIARMVATDTPYRVGARYAASNVVIAGERKVAQGLEKLGVGTERGARGLLGEHLADAEEARSAMAKGSAGFLDPGTIKTKYKTLYRRGDSRFAESWADELAQLHVDPIAGRIARGEESLADTKEWFWSGAGQKFRNEMASQRPDLAQRGVADAYIDSVLDRIKIKTGGDSRLMDAVATGHLEGKPIRAAVGDPRAAHARLGQLAKEGIGPERVKGDLTISARTGGEKALSHWDAATDHLMNTLMSRPSNYLSRSPAFSQFYWQRAEELLPMMDDAARASTIDAARGANLSKSQIGRLEQAAKRGAGTLDLEAADTVAKGFALDSTKKLLYDLSNRSQWSDVSRLVFPFGEAWKEILTTWARLGVESHGKPIRRAQQVIEGARGAGFFHTDEATGEEVFSYPGSQFVTEAVTGVPTPFTGNVASLNLFSNNPLLPGTGPLVQVSVGKLIPEKPQYDWLRDLVTPYGEAETSGGFVESFLPAWFQKIRKAMADPESDRLFGNTTFDMARYLKSTGKYGNDPDSMEQLQEDAVKAAKRLYMLRGLVQWGAPAAPTPKMMARDADGNLTTAFTLTEEFRKLQDADYTTAVEKFLDRFGEDALLYMQPKSQGGVTPTDTLHDWVRDNGDLVDRYPSVYAFFAPEGGEFSLTEMERQISTGERKAIKPEEAVKLANHRVASMIYRQARDKVGENMNTDNRLWLADIRDSLVDEYPGYEPARYDATKVPRMLNELSAAAADPRIARTDVGEALVTYLAARDKALAAARDLGRASFGKSKDTAHLRAWLRDIATDLEAEHPGFARLFDDGLSREMVDDTEDIQSTESTEQTV